MIPSSCLDKSDYYQPNQVQNWAYQALTHVNPAPAYGNNDVLIPSEHSPFLVSDNDVGTSNMECPGFGNQDCSAPEPPYERQNSQSSSCSDDPRGGGSNEPSQALNPSTHRTQESTCRSCGASAFPWETWSQTDLCSFCSDFSRFNDNIEMLPPKGDFIWRRRGHRNLDIQRHVTTRPVAESLPRNSQVVSHCYRCHYREPGGRRESIGEETYVKPII